MPLSSNDRSKPDSVTLNKDQVTLLAEVLQRVQPANLLPPEDWNEIANLTGATNSKAVKERLRYLTCALSGLSTKPSRAKGKAAISAPASPASKPAPAPKATKRAPMKRKSASQVEPLVLTHEPALKRRKTSTAVEPTIPEFRNTKSPSGLAEEFRDEEDGNEDNYATEEGILPVQDRVIGSSWDFPDNAYNQSDYMGLTAPVLRLPGYPAMDDIGLETDLLGANEHNNFGPYVEDTQFVERFDEWLP